MEERPQQQFRPPLEQQESPFGKMQERASGMGLWIGTYPWTFMFICAAVIAIIIIIIIIISVQVNKKEGYRRYRGSGNQDGGNYPYPFAGSHSAGAYGPLHTQQDYAYGETRPYASSAEGRHSLGRPWPSGQYDVTCPPASEPAIMEAQSLQMLQAMPPRNDAPLGPSYGPPEPQYAPSADMPGYGPQYGGPERGSARHMSDSQLGYYMSSN